MFHPERMNGYLGGLLQWVQRIIIMGLEDYYNGFGGLL